MDGLVLGLILVLSVALFAAGIVGAVCSIIGLVRGVTDHNATAIAVGGIGLGSLSATSIPRSREYAGQEAFCLLTFLCAYCIIVQMIK